jgi:hypothetical protein
VTQAVQQRADHPFWPWNPYQSSYFRFVEMIVDFRPYRSSISLTNMLLCSGRRFGYPISSTYSMWSSTTIDELGYLSYDHPHADLLFEVANRRYEAERSIVVTTKRPFRGMGRGVRERDLRGHAGRALGPSVRDHRNEAGSFRLREAEERPQRKVR